MYTEVHAFASHIFHSGGLSGAFPCRIVDLLEWSGNTFVVIAFPGKHIYRVIAAAAVNNFTCHAVQEEPLRLVVFRVR
jgi:hypothetical protein